MAFAIQTQILSLAPYRGFEDFPVAHRALFYAAQRSYFLPSATAVLGFSKTDRDVLGGWSAEGSERYSQDCGHADGGRDDVQESRA